MSSYFEDHDQNYQMSGLLRNGSFSEQYGIMDSDDQYQDLKGSIFDIQPPNFFQSSVLIREHRNQQAKNELGPADDKVLKCPECLNGTLEPVFLSLEEFMFVCKRNLDSQK